MNSVPNCVQIEQIHNDLFAVVESGNSYQGLEIRFAPNVLRSYQFQYQYLLTENYSVPEGSRMHFPMNRNY